MTVYISGKITGTDDYMERFAEAEAHLLEQGYDVVNPTKLSVEHPGMPWEWYMRRCIKLLCDCDAIYMLKGWRDSRGAIVERRIATDLQMVIMERNE